MELRRNLSTGMSTALGGHFHPTLLCYLDWPGGAVRVHSGVGVVSWDGHSWYGAGDLGRADIPNEQRGLTATEAQVMLMGLPPTIYDQIDDAIRGHQGVFYFGATTERAGNILVGDPTELFSGAMDSMSFPVRLEDEELVHSIKVGIRAGVAARGAAYIVHSAEDQAAAYPSDTAGRHLINNRANLEKVTWPET